MKNLALLILTCAIGTQGCKKPPVAQKPTREYVVLVDLSASRDEHTRNDDKAFVKKLVDSLENGDEIVILPIQQEGLRDHEAVGDFKMSPVKKPGFPTSQDAENLDGDRQAANDSVDKYFVLPTAKVMHTDIFSTLKLAGGYVHDSKAATTEILLMSDMLQSSKEVEMDHHRRMPTDHWLKEQVEKKELPMIAGSCVAVIGEDTTSEDDPAIRDYWKRYFTSAGAHLSDENIRPKAPGDVNDLCPR